MKAKFHDTEVEIKSFRDLTDAEMDRASCSCLPDHHLDPKELEGHYYLALAEKYPMTAFLLPSSIIFALREEAIAEAKRAVRNALDCI